MGLIDKLKSSFTVKEHGSKEVLPTLFDKPELDEPKKDAPKKDVQATSEASFDDLLVHNSNYCRFIVNALADVDGELKSFILRNTDEDEERFKISKAKTNMIIDAWALSMTQNGEKGDIAKSFIFMVVLAVLPSWTRVLRVFTKQQKLIKEAKNKARPIFQKLKNPNDRPKKEDTAQETEHKEDTNTAKETLKEVKIGTNG